jgi:hypothetical protein
MICKPKKADSIYFYTAAFLLIQMDRIREEKSTAFYNSWLANHCRKADIDSLASGGFNSVTFGNRNPTKISRSNPACLPFYFGCLYFTNYKYTAANKYHILSVGNVYSFLQSFHYRWISMTFQAKSFCLT